MGTTALVTGANRGIGFAVARRLAVELGASGTVFVAARDLAKAEKAIADIGDIGAVLQPVVLDLTDAATIDAAADLIEQAGGLDMLVQNAAFAPTQGASAAEEAPTMIAANNTGVMHLLRAFVPLLKDNARAIVVASGFGTLGALTGDARQALADETLTPLEVDSVMRAYVDQALTGTAERLGWPAWVNIPSKVGQVALTRAVAREIAANGGKERGILINAACPGWTMTEAAAPYLKNMPDVQAQSPDEAANDLLWLLKRPAEAAGPFGELVQHRKVIAFDGPPAG